MNDPYFGLTKEQFDCFILFSKMLSSKQQFTRDEKKKVANFINQSLANPDYARTMSKAMEKIIATNKLNSSLSIAGMMLANIIFHARRWQKIVNSFEKFVGFCDKLIQQQAPQEQTIFCHRLA